MSSSGLSGAQRNRLGFLFIILVGLGGLLLARLALWHLAPPEEVKDYSVSGKERPYEVAAARGDILDRMGHGLAVSTATYRIGASPELIGDYELPERVAQLAQILGREEWIISNTLSSGAKYVQLGAGLPAAVGEAVEDLDSGAFDIQVNYVRNYPDAALAGSVLGFVNYQGDGLYGVEQYYDAYLKGRPGEMYGVRDGWGQLVLLYREGYRPARDGYNLTLTIDRNVQYRAEQLLAERCNRHKAASGNLLVMEVKTGAILAMVNWPSYEPGRFWDPKYENQWANTSVSYIYEPGSVFKLLTVATALDAKVITPQTTYDDRGEVQIGEQRIYNADRRAHHQTSMTELLAYSLNVGSVFVATELGETRYYEVMRRFGFGEITGIDLALEEDGIMYVPGDAIWSRSNLATNSFGQGIAVTPLQVVAAFGAVANDGVLMRPYLVQALTPPALAEDDPAVRTELAQVRLGPQRIRQVVSKEAAQQATAMAADAVELGMQKALVPGYRLAGKGGTAGVPTEEGYRGRDVIASFVGYGPLPDPRFVVLVKLDKPTEGVWGVEIAAPAFADMMQYLFDYYGVPPTEGNQAQAASSVGQG
jgi:cell division protein FtsI/penicillin-binding protein 2